LQHVVHVNTETSLVGSESRLLCWEQGRLLIQNNAGLFLCLGCEYADLMLLLINGTDPSHNAGLFSCLGCDSADPMLLMMKGSEIQGQVC
jgi:hypothetical protein